MNKILLSLFLLGGLFGFFLSGNVLVAQTTPSGVAGSLQGDFFKNTLGDTGAKIIQTGDAKATLSQRIGQAIQLFLQILGVIMMLIVLYAGFLWLTAGGDKEQVGKAKLWITNATIGIAIIGVAYLLVAAVISFFITTK